MVARAGQPASLTFKILNTNSFCRTIPDTALVNSGNMPRETESLSTAVERTLLILEAAAHREDGLSNAEFSRKLKIPKSSASYILRTLEQHGYLRRDDESGKYRLGVKVLSLSRAALSGVDVREVALPIMRRLVEQIHITSHLAVLDHGEAVYVEKVEAPGFIKMDTWIGRRLAVHTTAVGKAILAFRPVAEQEKLIAERGLRKNTRFTITNPAKLLKELERVRALGYAVDDEENNLGVRCVGAPIFNAKGEVEASIASTGTTAAVTRDGVPRLAELIKDAARRISSQIGYRGPYPPA